MLEGCQSHAWPCRAGCSLCVHGGVLWKASVHGMLSQRMQVCRFAASLQQWPAHMLLLLLLLELSTQSTSAAQVRYLGVAGPLPQG